MMGPKKGLANSNFAASLHELSVMGALSAMLPIVLHTMSRPGTLGNLMFPRDPAPRAAADEL